MRRLYFCPRYTWLNTVRGSENFLMFRILRHAKRREIAVHIPQKGGRPTDIKVGTNGNGELLEAREVHMSLNIEVGTQPIMSDLVGYTQSPNDFRE